MSRFGLTQIQTQTQNLNSDSTPLKIIYPSYAI